jgi:hypothetical protein
MLRRRHGILRVTVRTEEVMLVPAPAALFFRRLEGASIMAPLAEVDDLPVRIDESLLAGLYYFRLARAAVGCWLDATKPLLLCNDAPVVNEAAIREETEQRAPSASTAFDLILRWNADVQTVRNERAAVEQVAALPLLGRDLRVLVERTARAAGVEPPSINQVRRRLAAWYRGRLRERVGPLTPPVANLPDVLAEIGRIGAALTPQLEGEAISIIGELAAQPSGATRVADTESAVLDGDAVAAARIS